MADEQAPAIEFDGAWPFNGGVKIAGHEIASVTAWEITAPADGLPVVTLTLVNGDALRLLLDRGAARVELADETREALISLGWTPPEK